MYTFLNQFFSPFCRWLRQEALWFLRHVRDGRIGSCRMCVSKRLFKGTLELEKCMTTNPKPSFSYGIGFIKNRSVVTSPDSRWLSSLSNCASILFPSSFCLLLFCFPIIPIHWFFIGVHIFSWAILKFAGQMVSPIVTSANWNNQLVTNNSSSWWHRRETAVRICLIQFLYQLWVGFCLLSWTFRVSCRFV